MNNKNPEQFMTKKYPNQTMYHAKGMDEHRKNEEQIYGKEITESNYVYNA